MPRAKKTARRWRYWSRLLFLIPFIAVLFVPFYNRVEPQLAGIPFFYWYQLGWILLGAAIVLLVRVIDTRITHVENSADRSFEPKDVPGDIL